MDSGVTFRMLPTGYEKNIFSNLQDAWLDFHDLVVDDAGFPGREKVLLYTNAAMNFKTSRHIELMPPIFLSIRSLCTLGDAPENIQNRLDEINGLLNKALEKYPC